MVGYIDDNTRLETGWTVDETSGILHEHMRDVALPAFSRLGLKFDLPEFQLIHFVSPRRHRTHYHPTPVKIGNTVVKPTEMVKLLGVMLDHKLIFRNHAELAQRRGTKAVLASPPPPSASPMPIRANCSSRP
jgi:hypothetical protein